MPIFDFRPLQSMKHPRGFSPSLLCFSFLSLRSWPSLASLNSFQDEADLHLDLCIKYLKTYDKECLWAAVVAQWKRTQLMIQRRLILIGSWAILVNDVIEPAILLMPSFLFPIIYNYHNQFQRVTKQEIKSKIGPESPIKKMYASK